MQFLIVIMDKQKLLCLTKIDFPNSKMIWCQLLTYLIFCVIYYTGNHLLR